MISSTPLLSFFFFFFFFGKLCKKSTVSTKRTVFQLQRGRHPFGVAHIDPGSTAMAQLETREQKQGGKVFVP